MAMEPVPAQKSAFASSFGGGAGSGPRTGGKGKGKGKGKFAGKRTPREPFDRTGGKYTPKLLGKAYFQRKKGCPFSGPKAPKIDYKDVRLLTKYISDYGKILPRHLTGVCALKQRELAQAIKRARILALLPYTSRAENDAPRPARGGFGSREGGREGRSFDRAPREPRAEAASVTAPAAE